MPSTSLVLTTDQRSALEARVRSGRGRADAARRARVILLLAEGNSYAAIATMTGCSSRTIALWKQRFAKDGLAGLAARHRGSKPTVLTPALEARIMTWTRRPPPHGATHWSTRSLGRKLGVQHTVIARAWGHAGLQPHRLERYMRSTDPEFETKAADVIGLYLDPPQHAVVFCIDEKTAIQALDRLDPVLPLSPGRAERHGFEYYRHGTLSLYAALNTRTGEVVGHTAARHTSAEFVGFLQTVVETQPRRREMHIIVDNLSAHKTQQVRTFLVAHPSVHLHYTPTYSSWLNQVELWFSKIERDVTARGIFTSVTDLRRKLMRYIKHYNQTATPIRWSYANPSRRIA
jgi:transposase